MTSIEVQAPQVTEEKIIVSTRQIFIDALHESKQKAQDSTLSPEENEQHRQDAEMFERLANEPTTDEMRLERFGTPLPEGHPDAPRSRKIGASALR